MPLKETENKATCSFPFCSHHQEVVGWRDVAILWTIGWTRMILPGELCRWHNQGSQEGWAVDMSYICQLEDSLTEAEGNRFQGDAGKLDGNARPWWSLIRKRQTEFTAFVGVLSTGQGGGDGEVTMRRRWRTREFVAHSSLLSSFFCFFYCHLNI